MKALLLHDIVPDSAVAEALVAAGHEVVRCAPPDGPEFPCLGAEGRCVLDGAVDVAVVVHGVPGSGIPPTEVGAICAMRDGIPIVAAGTDAPSPLRAVTDTVAVGIHEVVAACERAKRAREERLGRMVGGRVEVESGRARATLPAWADTADVVRAHQVLSNALPGAYVIDVTVSPR